MWVWIVKFVTLYYYTIRFDTRMCTCSDMKNAVIGNNKQKANLIVLGAVPRYVSRCLVMTNLSLCSSFKRVYKDLYLFSTSQVAVPLTAELLQCGAADWVLCGARQPCDGHRKQHQVLGGLSDHPCPSTRFQFHAVTHYHNPPLHVKLVVVSMLTGLLCSDLVFIEACLRCLRTVFISPVTPVQLLYTVGHLPVSLTGCELISATHNMSD